MRVVLSYEEQILNALMRIPAPSRHPSAIAYMAAQSDAIRAVLAPLYADAKRERDWARAWRKRAAAYRLTLWRERRERDRLRGGRGAAEEVRDA
jgi:hypothetical protein